MTRVSIAEGKDIPHRTVQKLDSKCVFRFNMVLVPGVLSVDFYMDLREKRNKNSKKLPHENGNGRKERKRDNRNIPKNQNLNVKRVNTQEFCTNPTETLSPGELWLK